MLTLFAPCPKQCPKQAFAGDKLIAPRTPESLIALLWLCLYAGLGSQTVWAGAVAIPQAAPQSIDRPLPVKPLNAGAKAASGPQSSLAISPANKPPSLPRASWVVTQQAVCDPTNRLIVDLEKTATALTTNLAAPTMVRPPAPIPKSAGLQSQQAYASWLMGLLALHGICMPLNTAQAASWFLRASELGEPLASAGMAWCAIEGCKLDANPTAAGLWINRLAASKPAKAQYLRWLAQARMAPLRTTLAGGNSVSINSTSEQDQLLLNAAKAGEVNAKLELGLIAMSNNQPLLALPYFRDAARSSIAGKTNLELVTMQIKTGAPLNGSEKDATTRPPINDPKTAAGNGLATGKALDRDELLAQARKYHRGQGVPPNYTQAIVLYQMAKDKGSIAAQKMLALIFSRPTSDGHIDIGWMQQLANIETDNSPGNQNGDAQNKNLRREPTPLFDLIPPNWRRFAMPTIGA